MLNLVKLTAIVFCFTSMPVNAYQTTAHKIVELESSLTGQTPDYKTLDKIIDESVIEIRKILPKGTKADKKTALKSLKTIYRVLRKNGFLYKSTDLLSSALSYCDADKCYYSDCDTSSYIYYSILSDVLEQDVILVTRPAHMFVRWQFPDKVHTNWETTENMRISDWEYNYAFPGSLDHELKTSEQVIASVYYTYAVSYHEKLEYNNALEHINKAIEMDPYSYNYYNERGVIKYKMGKFVEAINDYTYAIILNPNDPSYYGNRGVCYYALEKYQEALSDFDCAMSKGIVAVDYSKVRELALQRIKLDPVANIKQ